MKALILAMLATVGKPYGTPQGEHETIARAIDSATLREVSLAFYSSFGDGVFYDAPTPAEALSPSTPP